jgi:hypothetical protein
MVKEDNRLGGVINPKGPDGFSGLSEKGVSRK